jgi:flagellar FliJ protein
MKTSKRLKVVQRLAELRQQQAAEKLGQAVNEALSGQQQAEQLKSYQQEYSEQFKSSGAQGLSPMQLANYSRFFINLENAGKIQQERNTLIEDRLTQARLGWQKQYARQVNLESLIDKKSQQEQREEDNKQQREQDDRFNRSRR